jgi:hypothetical protein
MDIIRKRAEEAFNVEAEFNVWLRQLTEQEREHIIDMMADFHQKMIGEL